MAQRIIQNGRDQPVLHRDAALQQPFVDGAELLHREVPVVDPDRIAVGGDPREPVQHPGEGGVRNSDAAQQRCPPRVEQAAVVGRQAHVVAAAGDGAEQAQQARPPGGGAGRERASPGDGGSDFPAQGGDGEGPVAVVLHREQVAVLGVKQEQQPVKQHQRHVAQAFRPGGVAGRRVRVGGGEDAKQVREDLLEDRAGQPSGDGLLPFLRLGQGGLQGAAALEAGQEGGPAEQQQEGAQRGLAAGLQQGGEIGLKEALGLRGDVIGVEAPEPAVAEQRPPHAPAGQLLGETEVAEGLGRRGAAAGVGRPVQGQVPTLALVHDVGEAVAFRADGPGHGGSGGARIGEQQCVRHVLPPAGGLLLRQQVPAEQPQDGEDQALLGHRLVRRHGSAEGAEVGARCRGEVSDVLFRQSGPGRSGAHAGVQEIPAKQATTQHRRPTPFVHLPCWQNGAATKSRIGGRAPAVKTRPGHAPSAAVRSRIQPSRRPRPRLARLKRHC